MRRVIVFTYLILKHVTFSTVVDDGYSNSRRKSVPTLKAMRYFAVQLSLEITASAALLFLVNWMIYSLTWWKILTFLLLEIFFQTLGWAIERRASYRYMIATHLGVEFAFIVAYWLMAAYLLH